MLDLEDVARLTGARRVDLAAWIEERWVLPVNEGGAWRFSEVDVARVRLIVELRRDLRIGRDALPVVLSLLDRLNAVRRTARTLAAAIAELPEEQREKVLSRLAGDPQDGR